MAKLTVKITTNARQDKICGYYQDGILKIQIRAKPIRGKANQYLIQYLSKELGIHKQNIEIQSGYHAKIKIIEIGGISEEDLSHILQQLL